MAETRLTTVGSFPTSTEAHAARLLLASRGIQAMVVDEALVGNFWYLGNAVGGIKLQVDAADKARARQLLADEAALPDVDSDASPATVWICPQCRERVPANFEICWSCNTLRGPNDVEVALAQPDPESEPVSLKRPEAEKPVLPVRQSLCSSCGQALTASGLCSECGRVTVPNPYEAPLHPAPLLIKPPGGAMRQDRLAADALAQRAWRAAIFGTLFPLLNVYSVVLLLILAERHERLSPRLFGKVKWAWAVNLGVLLVMGTVLGTVLLSLFR